MRVLRAPWPLVAFAIVSAIATDARAGATSAENAIQRGVELRREHKDDEALAEFQRAYSIEPTARALAQIALAEASLEQWATAEADLLRALAAHDDWIERQREALQLGLSEIQSHLGLLEIVGPAGAQVWIDEALVAHLPKPFVRVPAKRLVVEVRAPGFVSVRQDVDVPAGGSLRLVVALEPEPPETRTPSQTPSQAPSGVPAPPAATAAERPAAERPATQRGQTGAAWVAVGSAGLSLAAGASFTALLADRVSHYNSDACSDRPDQPRSQRCAGDRSLIHEAEVGEAVSYGLAAAGALIATLLFIKLPGKKDLPRTTLVPIPGGAKLVYEF